MTRFLFVALAATCAPHAFAQTQQSEFERYALTVANPCLQAQMTAEGAADAVAKCEKTIADTTTLKQAVPDIAGHDLNVYHIVNTMAYARVARANGILHGVNTPKVCAGIEGAWLNVSQVAPAASPTYGPTIKTLTESTAVETEACRKLFPAPAGAPPLP